MACEHHAIVVTGADGQKVWTGCHATHEDATAVADKFNRSRIRKKEGQAAEVKPWSEFGKDQT